MRLQPAASASDLHACESALGASLHLAIWDLYRAANGVFDEAGQLFMIWPLDKVVERNRAAWAIEGTTRTRWVGFGDDGTGNPFCVPRDGGEAVSYWSPIDQKAIWLASSPALFWQYWVAGSLPPH